ncbi:enoyl-CoA hydratase [Rhodococcus sp. 06-621-2]|nr:enoyl-CoA hydratase/isomerase family protein [Rhodococcus sp. 06-621-2]OZC59732.1 enoyl-CoA hydratase [Rhodococcus sp. 06-621-2]
MSEVRSERCGHTVTPGARPAAPAVNAFDEGREPQIAYIRLETIGRIILDRPKALNALTTSMVRQIDAALDVWEENPGSALVLESSSPKAFCAGGDIRQIRQNTIDGVPERSVEFFASEYRLNLRLAELSTPVVSLVNGICMGGGMGLSVHGAFRVVGDNALLAMPETSIGFFPDVGGSHFLARLPGSLGTYLGLTGYRMDAADAMYTGLATHRVNDVGDVGDALNAGPRRSVDEVLRTLSPESPYPQGKLATHRTEIDWCFGAPTISGIRSRLKAENNTWSRDTLQSLDGMSPLSLEVTLAAITAGKQLTLARCLDMELQIATRLTHTADFVEGVRAGLVDKDKTPHWLTLQDTDFDYPAAGLWNRT